jgi:hypothetical protein
MLVLTAFGTISRRDAQTVLALLVLLFLLHQDYVLVGPSGQWYSRSAHRNSGVGLLVR